VTVRLLLAALGTVALLSTGIAQGTPATQKPRSAKSIECSKLTDAKGLHRKERRTFCRKCMKQKVVEELTAHWMVAGGAKGGDQGEC
jgi:hypothetical protein